MRPPSLLRRLLTPLASLRLAVVLLGLTMLLVLVGTLAQRDQGIWQVQHEYFHCFAAWASFDLFVAGAPGGMPIPGGYTLIGLIMVNLIAAHATRLRFTWADLLIIPELAIVYALAWPFYAVSYYMMMGVMVLACAPLLLHGLLLHRKRGGIIMIHVGLSLLILGEVVTSLFAQESQMTLTEGQSSRFSQDIRSAELAIIDPSPAENDRVMVIADSRLARGGTIRDGRLPFDIRIDRYHPNSGVLGPEQMRRGADGAEALANAGSAAGLGLVGLPPEAGTDGGVDAAGAFITPTKDGRPLGTYLVSVNLQQPQRIQVDGQTYLIEMRFKRIYRPYSVELVDFRHDRFLGTDVPRNYSSDIKLSDPRNGERREVRIWMNHPLRYDGETYYQSGFRGEQTTILQVVRNPGVLLPYVSCTVISIGLLLHFAMHLSSFLRRRAQAAAEAIALSGQGGRSWSEGWALPMGVVAVAGSALIVTARPVKLDGGFDLATFSKLPLSFEGRVMPLDSLARNTLRVISGRAAYRPGQGPAVPAIAWLADVMANPEKAEQYPIFRIEDRDVQSLLGLDTQRQSLRYSYAEVLPQRPKLLQQASTADAMASRSRSPYQQHILELWGHVALYDQVASVSPLYLAPPIRPGEQWQTLGESIQGQPPNFAGIAPPAPSNPGAAAMVEMLQSYRAGDLPAFNAAANDYRADLSANLPAMQRRAEFEVLFNRLQPFLAAAAMYVLIFLVAAGSWLGWATPLRRTALLLLMLTLVLHTLALAGRIYIQGRPPVTNLYSSAIFIGWAIGVLALVLELIHRNTFGIVVASVAGFLSLLVAHNLSGDGDTMRMLQAVLDTNFWLATHVIAITIGYASTFLAGLLAITYILGGVLVRDFDEPIRKALARMVYGIVCFAMIFSFVGTILGGIWADQSWGRFWGWDPKENGAALLVLWNAIILHCRFGGIVRERGLMQLAVFGNVVTAWSWFGTNMLGVGLHAYGFMDSAVFWLGTFMMCQMLIIALGSLPLHHWRSLQAEGEQNPSRSH